MLHEQGGHTVLGRTAVVRGAVVLCAVILLGIMGAGCAADSTVGASATSSVTHTPTATPLPAVKENAAVLGGAVYAFDNKLGSSNCCYRNGWDNEGPYGVVWTGVWYDGYTGGAINEQSKVRVKTMSIAAIQDTPANWSVSQADALSNPYLPPDAKYKGTISVKDIAGGVTGTEKRYTSALLANTLPASDFTDVNGHAVAPGTFYVYYKAQYNGSPVMLVGWCVLSTDEHDAQSL
jgi:hypothetical protein